MSDVSLAQLLGEWQASLAEVETLISGVDALTEEERAEIPEAQYEELCAIRDNYKEQIAMATSTLKMFTSFGATDVVFVED